MASYRIGVARQYILGVSNAGDLCEADDVLCEYLEAALRVVEAARAVDACLETYCFADPTHPDRIAFEKALDDLTAALAEWED